MEAVNIKTQTTWADAAAQINSNTQKIVAEVNRLGGATYKNMGYFLTLAALKSAYPTASMGAKAYVGSKFPYAVYLWNDSSNTWIDSGQTGGNESLNLGNYYTKDETNTIVSGYYTKQEAATLFRTEEQTAEQIEQYHVVLSQEDYDALETKGDRFYYIIEG